MTFEIWETIKTIKTHGNIQVSIGIRYGIFQKSIRHPSPGHRYGIPALGTITYSSRSVADPSQSVMDPSQSVTDPIQVFYLSSKFTF